MTRTYKEIEGRVNFDVSAMDSGFSVRIPQVRDDSGYTKQEEHVFTTYTTAAWSNGICSKPLESRSFAIEDVSA